MKEIITIIDKLRTLSGNEQIEELKKHKDNELLREILIYTYDPHRKFKISDKKFDTRYELAEPNWDKSCSLYGKQHHWDSFKNFLDKFNTQKSVTYEQIDELIFTFWSYLEDDILNLFKGILLKDLRLGLNIKTINKAFGEETVQDGCVSLAKDYNGKMPENAMISRKIDGKRGYIKNGVAYGRSNKAFKTEPIKHIIEQIKKHDPDGKYVYDGEFAYLEENENFKEDFQKTISLLSSDDRTPECDKIYFCIFNRVPIEEWELKQATMKDADVQYSMAYDMTSADNMIPVQHGLMRCFDNIAVFRQYPSSSLDNLLKSCKKYNWEGLVIRDGDVTYQFKRSSSFQRLKEMQDSEFKVIGYVSGKPRSKYAKTLGALTIQLPTGEHVDVGSGYSDILRDKIWAKKNIIIEKELYAKVQYFKVTTDKKGKNSLRFPVFVAFRDINTMEEINIDCI